MKGMDLPLPDSPVISTFRELPILQDPELLVLEEPALRMDSLCRWVTRPIRKYFVRFTAEGTGLRA